MELDFTEQERATLDSLIEGETFLVAVERWQRVVESVEGYAFSIYDYDNDIGIRQYIQDTVSDCPIEIQVKVWAALRSSDLAFFAATQSFDRPRYPLGSWHRRLPSRPGEELVSDIASENL